MIIYNTTYHIHPDSEKIFIEWIKKNYIPRAVESGVLTVPQLALVMSEEKNEGSSYSLQFTVDEMADLESWYKEIGIELVKELETKFSNHVAGFSTLMNVVDIDI